jgi:hypothetical protein
MKRVAAATVLVIALLVMVPSVMAFGGAHARYPGYGNAWGGYRGYGTWGPNGSSGMPGVHYHQLHQHHRPGGLPLAEPYCPNCAPQR